MADCLVWHDISMKQVYDFYDQQTPEEGLKCVSGYFPNDPNPEKNAILSDFYYYILTLAKENGFTPEKASALFSIMKTTHARVTSSPFIRLEADYAFFKELLLKHCINRPPFSEQVFTFAEMKIITEFATNTYFRHYLMYKYTFTKQIKLDFKITNAYMTPAASVENLITTEVAGEDATLASVAVAVEVPAAPIEIPVPAHVEPATIAPTVPETNVAEQSKSDSTSGDATEEPKEPKTLEESKQEIASAELRNLVLATLGPKLEEMKAALLNKMWSQEELLGGKIKKLEAEEEKILAAMAAADKKKDPKAKGKK